MRVYDLKVASEVEIFGKKILIYDCDQYTREFYENLGIPQAESFEPPLDNFEERTQTKFVPVKDNTMKDYLEHKLGGGRVKPEKQFLENDRRVFEHVD